MNNSGQAPPVTDYNCNSHPPVIATFTHQTAFSRFKEMNWARKGAEGGRGVWRSAEQLTSASAEQNRTKIKLAWTVKTAQANLFIFIYAFCEVDSVVDAVVDDVAEVSVVVSALVVVSFFAGTYSKV